MEKRLNLQMGNIEWIFIEIFQNKNIVGLKYAPPPLKGSNIYIRIESALILYSCDCTVLTLMILCLWCKEPVCTAYNWKTCVWFLVCYRETFTLVLVLMLYGEHHLHKRESHVLSKT